MTTWINLPRLLYFLRYQLVNSDRMKRVIAKVFLAFLLRRPVNRQHELTSDQRFRVPLLHGPYYGFDGACSALWSSRI